MHWFLFLHVRTEAIFLTDAKATLGKGGGGAKITPISLKHRY